MAYGGDMVLDCAGNRAATADAERVSLARARSGEGERSSDLLGFEPT